MSSMIKSSTVSVSKSDPDIRTLCGRIEEGSLLLTPRFQRSKGIWEPWRRSRLIESLLLGIPVPPIYVARLDDGNEEVVDGLQRLDAIQRYVSGNYGLTHLEFLTDLTGLRFGRLSESWRRRLLQTSLPMLSVPTTTVWGERICHIIFDRINKGLPLSVSEQARGVDFMGHFRSLVDALTPEVLRISGVQTPGKRSSQWTCAAAVVLGALSQPFDGEDLVLAGLPFHKAGNNPRSTFLRAAQAHVDAITEGQRTTLLLLAQTLLCTIEATFGPHALRRVHGEVPSGRIGFSSALFQAVVCFHDDCGEVAGKRAKYTEVTRSLPPLWIFERGLMAQALRAWYGMESGETR